MNLNISMWSGFFYEMTPEEAVKQLSKANYAFAELSTEHAEKMLQRSGTPESIGQAFGAGGREQGVCVLQGHL